MSEQNLTGKLSAEAQQITASSGADTTNQVTHPDEKREQTEAQSPKKLTAEEQMALYEKALKEDDWGHQPC